MFSSAVKLAFFEMGDNGNFFLQPLPEEVGCHLRVGFSSGLQSLPRDVNTLECRLPTSKLYFTQNTFQLRIFPSEAILKCLLNLSFLLSKQLVLIQKLHVWPLEGSATYGSEIYILLFPVFRQGLFEVSMLGSLLV